MWSDIARFYVKIYRPEKVNLLTFNEQIYEKNF